MAEAVVGASVAGELEAEGMARVGPRAVEARSLPEGEAAAAVGACSQKHQLPLRR